MSFVWGLLGPETLSSTRRTRTLGLASAVRYFNDRAVPGLGGVWYGKQVMLATLGVVVAEEARKSGAQASNIEVANAIEALACWQAFKKNKWKRDSRLRGSQKLQSKGDDFKFSRVKQRNFYVTQPMRMATVQALPALSLVKANGSRFNAFESTQDGLDFIKSSGVNWNALVNWVTNGSNGLGGTHHQDKLHPNLPLESDATRLLKARLQQGSATEFRADTERRSKALAWVASLQPNNAPTLKEKPIQLDEDHWHDIVAGALFFKAQGEAVAVLDAVEADMEQKLSLVDGVKKASTKLDALKTAAQAFLDYNSNNQDANAFCRECVVDDPKDALKALVARDGAVLKLDGDEIRPGPAFCGTAATQFFEDEETADSPSGGTIPLPEGVSFRLRNLYLLNLDLNGQLDAWLKKEDSR